MFLSSPKTANLRYLDRFHPCLNFSSPSRVSVSRFGFSVLVCNTVPATTLSSHASKVRFALFFVLQFPGSVTGKRRLLTHPSDSTREFGVQKMRWRGMFCYVYVAVQYLSHGFTWAAKTIIFKFRDFVSEEFSDFLVGFLHLNLLILRVLHSYVEDKGLLIKLRV